MGRGRGVAKGGMLLKGVEVPGLGWVVEVRARGLERGRALAGW
jgi:hypothetical protein